ncbi:MAG: hypothetical protein Q4P66_07120 [Actinomycetaceae bacterium]|nr:hypothetical protein [Actinomycetaceae bacterium]
MSVHDKMSTDFPQWSQWKDIIQGAYLMEQCAVISTVASSHIAHNEPSVSSALNTVIERYGKDIVQSDVFDEAPFSYLRTFVWAMTALQLIADANMYASYQAHRQSDFDMLRGTKNLALLVTTTDLHQIVRTAEKDRFNDDSLEVDDAFVELISHAALMTIHAQRIDTPMTHEEVEQYGIDVPKSFYELDRYQQFGELSGIIHFEGLIGIYPSMVEMYHKLSKVTLGIDPSEFYAKRVLGAANYVMTHRSDCDRTASDDPSKQEFSVTKLWNKWAAQICRIDWHSVDGTLVRDMYARFSQLTNQRWVVTDSKHDDANSVTCESLETQLAVFRPEHLHEQRAVGYFALLKTPADLEKKKHPRLGATNSLF